MTFVLEKDAEFRWTNAQQAAFDELKKRLTTAPVLTLPDQQKKFIVCYDASRDGLGCVLMQEGTKLAELYISRIVCLHGVPKRIISDRDSQFTSHFWEQLHDSLDTKLRFSTAYHPQTDGQTERTNQILEDMLRACAIHYGPSWDKCLPYAEFFYNNNYQASLKKSPFEALYGKRCRTPLFWNQTCEKQSRKRSYADVRRRDLSFKVDDHVYLKVSSMRRIRRFNMKGKLAPRYIRPFKILEKKVEEVLDSARRASTARRIGGIGGSDLHRASSENFGHLREEYQKQKDQDVPCAVQSS
ncbi:hypothetical protein U9M48_009129 [Paspalum notatum var. saurae]|uniref:Integrase catalytic domain-containing protein n=1 Tax=Paspalum notatum var. saurae TaxID=547442 RepID=A0AAQ3SR45_PASNO